MTSRIRRARPRALEVDESLYGHAESHGRRWDDQPVRPSKFTQRLAVVLALTIITACVGMLLVLCGVRA